MGKVVQRQPSDKFWLESMARRSVAVSAWVSGLSRRLQGRKRKTRRIIFQAKDRIETSDFERGKAKEREESLLVPSTEDLESGRRLFFDSHKLRAVETCVRTALSLGLLLTAVDYLPSSPVLDFDL